MDAPFRHRHPKRRKRRHRRNTGRPKPQEPRATTRADGCAKLSLEQLARVEPPRYEAPRLRSTPDEATARFQRGMGHYRKADYAAAVGDLRAAAELDPDAAHIRFFLGISHLMLGQDDAAIDRLRATIALGDSPYLEEAHLYLAKAFLRRKDLGAAETQLKTLIQLRGSGSDEAKHCSLQHEKAQATTTLDNSRDRSAGESHDDHSGSSSGDRVLDAADALAAPAYSQETTGTIWAPSWTRRAGSFPV